MALLFMDGFDHYATADVTKKWPLSGAGIAILPTAGRRGGGAFHSMYTSSSSPVLVRALAAPVTTLVAGFALKLVAIEASSTNWIFGGMDSAGARQFSIAYDRALGKLYLVRNSTVLAVSNVALAVGAYYYIELKVVLHASTGSYELKINGATDLSASGVDTKGTTLGNIGTLRLGGDAIIASQFHFDDFYVCDGSGSVNNDFLGDVRVDTLFPTADGNYAQLTPSTGTSHFALVDEVAPNTTDYVSSGTAGHRDSFVFQDLPALSSQTIYGVQVNTAALKADSGSRGLASFARLSATDADASTVNLSTSQLYVVQQYETKPGGGAWTESDVNSAEFGVKVV